ncbi:MAG: branched-chain amino acid ABC transporter permease [Alphaproteobacteria bacterium]|nr:branched-chain amino acid ABC transporter permease [Alphaproteobacteria bacterium]
MEYLLNLGILFSIYGVLALSLNMVVGMAGLLSLAQAAFYGIGAYATAIGMTELGLNFFVSLGLGAVINIVAAGIVGRILSRWKSDYYAVVSMGFSIIVFSVLLNWKELTRGPLGIFGIPKPSIFGYSIDTNLGFLMLCLFILGIVFGIYRWIDRSSFGRAAKAIREDEQLAQVMGYPTRRIKSILFGLSAVVAGVAGGLFASYIAFIDPTTFQVKEGIFLFTIIIIGGLASSRGAVLGALILLSLPEVLRFIGLPFSIAAQMQQIIYGSALVLMMVFKPKGFLGKYRM